LIDEICLYQPVVGYDGIRGVFVRAGGILKPPSGDPTQLVQHADIIEDLTDIKDLLTKVFDERCAANKATAANRRGGPNDVGLADPVKDAANVAQSLQRLPVTSMPVSGGTAAQIYTKEQCRLIPF
jgi:hypothetical protein